MNDSNIYFCRNHRLVGEVGLPKAAYFNFLPKGWDFEAHLNSKGNFARIPTHAIGARR